MAWCFVAGTEKTGLDRPRLALSDSYDPEVLLHLKQKMPKGAWHPDHGIWSWPLTLRSCERLRKVYGDKLEVSRGLSNWYKLEKARLGERERQKELSLARRAREAEESSKLAEERALYGDTDHAGLLEPGVPGQVPSLPDDFLEVDRTPPRECPPVESPWIKIPDDPNFDERRLEIQREGAAWLVQNRGGALADETGLGKSLTLLMAMLDPQNALAGPHLIVAPLKPAAGTWPREIAKFVPKAEILPWQPGKSGPSVGVAREYSLRSLHLDADHPMFLIVNFDALYRYEKELSQIPWASIVVDEADQALSIGHRDEQCRGDTKVARALCGLTQTDQQLRVVATGTPFRGKLRYMWGLIDFIEPGVVGPSQKSFGRALTERATEEGAGVSLDRIKTGQEAAWAHIMTTWVLRRTHTAAQRALLSHRELVVDPTPGQLEQDREWRDRKLWVGPKTEATEKAVRQGKVMVDRESGRVMPDVIVAVTRRIQLSVGEMVGLDDQSMIDGERPTYGPNSSKVNAAIELLRDWGVLEHDWWHMAGEKGKVIIGSPWTSALDLMETRLAVETDPELVVRIDGKTSARQLERAIDEFNGPRGPSILLLSSTAGGAGLTLDPHCSRMIILAEHWTEDVQAQLVGRINNRTWKGPREIVTIRTSGMLDSYLAHRTEHQRGTQGMMLEIARAGAEDE